MSNKKIYIIDKVFPIRSKNYIIVHMNENEWSLKGECIVSLVCEDRTFTMKYVGFGNVNNQLTLVLVPPNMERENILNIYDYFERPHKALYLEF